MTGETGPWRTTGSVASRLASPAANFLVSTYSGYWIRTSLNHHHLSHQAVRIARREFTLFLVFHSGPGEPLELGCSMAKSPVKVVIVDDHALLDVDLPKLDGLELVKRLLEKMPAVRLITMTGRMDPYTIWRVSQSGVHGLSLIHI